MVHKCLNSALKKAVDKGEFKFANAQGKKGSGCYKLSMNQKAEKLKVAKIKATTVLKEVPHKNFVMEKSQKGYANILMRAIAELRLNPKNAFQRRCGLLRLDY